MNVFNRTKTGNRKLPRQNIPPPADTLLDMPRVLQNPRHILDSNLSQACANRVLFAALVLLIAACLSPAAPAQDKPYGQEKPIERSRVQAVLDSLGRGRSLGPVAISPDGKLIASVRQQAEGWRVALAPFSDPARTVRITAAKKEDAHCGESMVAWAPDSHHLAFVGNCQSADMQDDVFLATISGDVSSGKPKIAVEKLTQARGEVGFPEFSPDGSKIAFLYVEGATRAAGALAAMKPWAGVIGEDGVEIQRIGLVDSTAKQAKPQFATPANLHVYEFDWRPDSQGLAYIAAQPPGENNWWVAKLYAQSLGESPRTVLAPAEVSGPLHGLQIAVPRWSPDGSKIAFIGGLMSDQGSTGGDLWTVSSAGGDPAGLTDQTEGRTTSPAWMTWAGNDSLYVSELAGGNNQLVRLNLSESDPAKRFSSPIYSLPATVGDGKLELSLSTTADRSLFVFNASSFDHPLEIYAAQSAKTGIASLDGLQNLSGKPNSLEDASWGAATSLDWPSDGFRVQGWLLAPKGYDPAHAEGKRYPLIVLVHGGPSAAVTASWGGRGSLNAAAFSALGYFVLQPNPRGSFGQGEAFTAANRKDFGYGDLRDIVAGVDTVLAKYPIDSARVGLTGWSYGGFMTMFAVTQTHRFKAAVAGAGIANWLSYYGENSIDQWMTPFFGDSVYKTPEVYAKSSAINYIDKVKTPVLVVVGDRDGECPAPQSFEFWHALREQHVPTQLVVYPNEGHGFVDPEHRTDVLYRAVEWFARYMPEGK